MVNFSIRVTSYFLGSGVWTKLVFCCKIIEKRKEDTSENIGNLEFVSIIFLFCTKFV